ncbi:MAG TPA: OmpA family protein [Bacteroidia bacterium]|jgi:outer membrane protein OmpA-like peptidoglycan-associated protein
MIRIRNIETIFLKAFLLLAVSLFSYNSFSQDKKGKNLVPNPSFETKKNKGTDIKSAIPWKGVGTVDYYSKPDKRDTSRYKGARTGIGYAGLRFQSDYKEYMHVKLAEPLEKGKVYQFKMYIRLLEANNVTVTIKQLGAYFSDEEFRIGMIFEEAGLVDTTYNKGISGTLNWMLIQGDYTAHGGEKYIIIGNFRTKMKDDFVKKNKWSLFEFKEAYYYIDDISLREKLPEIDSVAISKEGGIVSWLPYAFKGGQKFEIKDLEFEKGTALILSSSYEALDDVVKMLISRPLMSIQISGHMDKFGTEEEEKKLSKERAKAVYDYFKKKSVTNPMIFKGYGASQPIAPNNSEEYKAKNRRVEVVIIKE